eukprot:RCo029940
MCHFGPPPSSCFPIPLFFLSSWSAAWSCVLCVSSSSSVLLLCFFFCCCFSPTFSLSRTPISYSILLSSTILLRGDVLVPVSTSTFFRASSCTTSCPALSSLSAPTADY